MKISTTTRYLHTKGFSKAVLLFCSLLSVSSVQVLSQDLYDLEHSRKYAEYLYSGRQYGLAAEEYERLAFLQPSNTGFRLNLVKSYRLSGNLKSGLARLSQFYGNEIDTMPVQFASEYIKMSLLEDSVNLAETFLERNKTITGRDRNIYGTCVYLLKGDYLKASTLITEFPVNDPLYPAELRSISAHASGMRFKKPFVAGALSAVIPGTGKFYTKNWGDGIFAMVFVFGNAWQAYRGFHEHGSKSALGWTFASLSASFYIGNVFGSVKAARRYNKNLTNDVENKVFDFIHSDSF